MVTQTQLRQRGITDRKQVKIAKAREIDFVERKRVFEEQKELAKQEFEKQKALVAEQNRINALINRVASGKPLPIGTSKSDAQAVAAAIQADPELKKAVERVSTRQVLGKQIEAARMKGVDESTVISELTEPQITSIQRMGLIRVKEPEAVMKSPEVSTSIPTSGFKIKVKEPDRTGQIYSPQAKAFLTPTYGLGAGGTATYSSPTPQEAFQIEAAQTKGSGTEIIEKVKGGFQLYEDKVIRPFSETKFIQSLRADAGAGLEKTGKALAAYQEAVVRPLSEEGVTVKGRQVLMPIGETPIGVIGSDIARTKRYVERLDPEKKIIIGDVGTRRVIKAGELQGGGLYSFGKKVVLGEVEEGWTKASKTFGASDKTAKRIGKGAKLTTEFAPYLIGGVYVSEVGIKAGEAAFGGKFGGEKSLYTFVKKNPLEVGLATTIVGVKGVNILTGKAKQAKALAKYKQYTDQAEKTTVKLTSKPMRISPTRPQNILRPKLKASAVGKGKKALTLKPVVKGKVEVIQKVPSKTYTGKVVEERLVDSKKFWDKVLEKKVQQTFKGTASLSPEGVLTQKISYIDAKGAKITKIVTSPKTGKDTIQIFKGGKEVLKIQTPKVIPPKITFKEKRPVKVKVDSSTFGDVGAKRVTVGKGKAKKVFEQRTPGGKVTQVSGDSRPLQTGKLSAKIDVSGKVGRDARGLTKVDVRRVTSTEDVIGTKTRKLLVERTTKKGSGFVKTERAQDIKIGVDKSGDIAGYYRDAAEKIAFQKTSPITKRGITSTQAQEVIYEFVKPTSKAAKESAAKTAAKAKVFQKKVKAFEKSQKEAEKLAKKIYKQEAKAVKLSKGTPKIVSAKTATAPTAAQQSAYTFGGPEYARTLTQAGESPNQFVKTLAKVGQSPKQLKLPGTVYVPQASAYLSPAPVVKVPEVVLELSKQGVGLDIGAKLGLLSILKPRTKRETLFQQEPATDVIQEPDQTPEYDIDNRTISAQLFAPEQSTDTDLDFTTSEPPPPPPTKIQRPRVPPTEVPRIRLIDLPEEAVAGVRPGKKVLAGAKQGYHPEVKERGKWKRIAKKPRTKKEALALAGFVVDNSTAVQLRLIKAKKPAIKETVKRRINRGKYRDYSVRAGKRTPLSDHGLIELKKNRIDTRGEKQQLTASKLLKGKRYKSLGRKKRTSRRKQNFLFGGGFGGSRQRLF